jgi:peptidoglycan-N-acetylglucosamine deacetylase
MRVTLSFDNGPDPDVTPQVLTLLAKAGVRAHFFVLGKHLVEAKGRRLVERAVAEGHLVGNHSFSHQTPFGADPRPARELIEREIVATDRLLAPLLPAGEPRRFRPFGGGGVIGPHLLRAAVVAHLVQQRASCVLWSSVPRDWEDPDGWPATALADCARLDHALVVLHDVPGAAAGRLAAFLDALGERGADIVPELPLDCTPLLDGRVVGSLAGLVADAAEAPASPSLG